MTKKRWEDNTYKYNCIRHKWIGKGWCPECDEIAKSEADYQNNCPFRVGEGY